MLFVVLCMTSPLFASFSSKDKGTTTAGFLKLGVGGRAVAMGEAYSAVADDASALYWNTGALNHISSKTATFMHALYIESSYFDYLAYAQPINDVSAFGIGLQHLSAGSITKTDETGSNTGTFAPTDMAITLGYARMLRDFSIGIGAKFIQSKIIDSASAFAGDLGIMAPPLMDDKLKFAFTATNIGSKMKFDVDEEDLPMAMRLGSSYRIKDEWISSLDIAFPKDNAAYFAFGTEYLFPVNDTWKMAARTGLNTRTMSDVDGFSGISFGLGFIYQKLLMDYAFFPLGDIGTTHRISFSLRF
ncbi:PorV/PorQ family protein [Elusimicrobiota bacterium]